MKNNHGGKRAKSGRKKVADPAQQLSIYPKHSIIKAVGGAARAKVICLAALLTEASELEKPLKKNLVK